MRNKVGSSVDFEIFTWKIEDFTKKDITKLSSKAFKIRGYTWKLVVHPVRNDVNHFSLYLMVADNLPPYGWTRNTFFKLALINQVDRRKSIVKDTQQKFNGGHRCWGSFFMNLKDFHDHRQGYLVRNTCIIEAHICVSNFPPPLDTNIINPINDDYSILDNNNNTNNPPPSTTNHANLRSSCDEITNSPSTSSSQSSSRSSPNELLGNNSEIQASSKKQLRLRDLIDLQALKDYIPLLEEVCTWHPSLLHSQKNRTQAFRLWAFTSLGQVLHFLKTKKVKDIDDNDIKTLQGLWDELEKSSGFELAWLQPYVEAALSVKAHLQKTKKLKKLVDHVVGLEIKMKKLRGELAAAEAEFEIARKDLSQVRKGFQKMDVNATIGYAMF
ncbi:hypothetical protein HN51_023410 [Arachis hypogaea]|uniref:MATH domain-containing protein n=2 Tax=Arachis TaxID=3817 RepID=A0A445E585_ARAHY|nr:MATH domain and coiled-coil domain-containing protein At3g58270-like [Arachis duranensis]XP_025661235.1 MATH domain and coiled-coil domain-containing protein At3g58270 [Arachis hypogaea]QHO26240.1 Ubiquitin carboxyl-terminal hydrolase [Arachis hypogaea]RYR70626.1 hypothetical protein Ahy_A02g004961 [Arachis hypogaea]